MQSNLETKPILQWERGVDKLDFKEVQQQY